MFDLCSTNSLAAYLGDNVTELQEMLAASGCLGISHRLYFHFHQIIIIYVLILIGLIANILSDDLVC